MNFSCLVILYFNGTNFFDITSKNEVTNLLKNYDLTEKKEFIEYKIYYHI